MKEKSGYHGEGEGERIRRLRQTGVLSNILMGLSNLIISEEVPRVSLAEWTRVG